MEQSTTFVGQKTNPFILSMNLKDIDKNRINLIQRNKENEPEFISGLSAKYKNEIAVLKNYIEKMNFQIRNNFNMEIVPSIEEGFSSFSKKIKNGAENTEELQDCINKWMSNLLNVDYINPLITLYEKYITNLKEELNYSKSKNKEYENLITKLVNENNDLRNQIQTAEEELKNFLEVRNESGGGSNMLIMDRDYIMKIEERNQLLSKENEILVVNYNKIQNELMQLKGESGLNDNMQNDNNFHQLNQQHLKLMNDYNILQGQFDVNKQKVLEVSNINSKLDNENFNLKQSVEKMKNELDTYKSTIETYKKLLNNK